jgi:hypothetical protein
VRVASASRRAVCRLVGIPDWFISRVTDAPRRA